MSSAAMKMPHSHSTPVGVDGGSRTPPTTPRKAGKMLAFRIQMLDDSMTMFQVQSKAIGRVLFDQVCKQLHLLEADYFGLEYQETNGTKYWLDLEKPVCRQVGLSLVDPLLKFCVKFYTPDPAQLEEEFTRYLFCLQIKRDLSQGLLQCNDNTAALMASYIVQAECGDYVIEDYPDHTYLSTYKFVPHQDTEIERRIMENHKKHASQSPAEADLNLLETARRCELYGIKMHAAKDHEAVSLNLAVAHMGIIVFQHYTKINTFSWAKIRKISFKRKKFLIKLHPEGYGYYKDTVEFFFEGRNECKNFWKKCVENHGFFRCSVVKRIMRQKTRVLSRGSSFRYSGKTQKQIVEFVRDNYVKRQTFQRSDAELDSLARRSNSFRQTSSGRALQGSEGGGSRGATSSSSLLGSSSISAHPLLPLGDPALETPVLSLSCGSMILDSPTTVTNISMAGANHHCDDTAMFYRTLTSIDVHSPATPYIQGQVLSNAMSQQHQQQQVRNLSTGRICPSNSSPPEFPAPRPLPRYSWQRSASCRDLYTTRFEDSVNARISVTKTKELNSVFGDFQLPQQGELDNPVTRCDDINHSYSVISSKLPLFDSESIPHKIYSSSYPGTSSLYTESWHGELAHTGDLSHEDLSHDSYELLEREIDYEYPESCSSPCDENNSPSDHNEEEIEPEIFQMDYETDSFKKQKSIHSVDRQIFKSVRSDIKKSKNSKVDQYTVLDSQIGIECNVTETRSQRSNTKVEGKFDMWHSNSIEQQNKTLSYQNPHKVDPIVLQVQMQKMVVLNDIKNFRSKHKITHVDSEILRDKNIMKPKLGINDESSQNDVNKSVSRRSRTRSIVSLDDNNHPPLYIETGSLGSIQRAREKKATEAEMKIEKILSKMQNKDRISLNHENLCDILETKKLNIKDCKSTERIDTHFSHSIEKIDLNEIKRNYELYHSLERLDLCEQNNDRDFDRDKYFNYYNNIRNNKRKHFEQFNTRELRKSLENLDSKNYKNNHQLEFYDKKEKNREKFDARYSPSSSHSIEQQQMYINRKNSGSMKNPIDKFKNRYTDKNNKEKSIFKFDTKDMEKSSFYEQFDLSKKDNQYDRFSNNRKSIENFDYVNLCGNKKSLNYILNKKRKSIDSFDCGNYSNIVHDSIKINNEQIETSREIKFREMYDWKNLEKSEVENEHVKLIFEKSGSDKTCSVPEKTSNFMTKATFAEYNPKVIGNTVSELPDESLVQCHIPIERTKSDPNPSRHALGSNSKRHVLMHQKSIDITPADSGEEDAFIDGNQNRKSNIDIPYTLHKRHVMNGTATNDKSEIEANKLKKIVTDIFNRDVSKLPLNSNIDTNLIGLTKLTSPIKKSTLSLSSEKPYNIILSSDKSKIILNPFENSKSTLHSKSLSNISPDSSLKLNTNIQVKNKMCPKSSSLEKTKPDSIVETIVPKGLNFNKNEIKFCSTDLNTTFTSVLEKKSSNHISHSDSTVATISAFDKRNFSNFITRSVSISDKLNFMCTEDIDMETKQKLDYLEKLKENMCISDDDLDKQKNTENVATTNALSCDKFTKNYRKKPSAINKFQNMIQKPSQHILTSSKPVSSRKKLKSKDLEKVSSPEKASKSFDKMESQSFDYFKYTSSKVSQSKLMNAECGDFLKQIINLPLDEAPIKPQLELDSLKVPEFTPYMFKSHGESMRSKSLSLAEEKTPIDTLLSPPIENKNFIKDLSSIKNKKIEYDAFIRKDFKKQSKSLEGDKPPLKKSGLKEIKTSPSSLRVDKSKLGKMPQEIIIIDSTEVIPQVSIIQKGKSKSVSKLTDRSFSLSTEDNIVNSNINSSSVNNEIKKIIHSLKNEKSRPKSFGSFDTTGRKDSIDKLFQKKCINITINKSDMSKLSSNVSPKVSPKVSPRASPKISPKTSPKISSKASIEKQKSIVIKSDKKIQDIMNKEEIIISKLDEITQSKYCNVKKYARDKISNIKVEKQELEEVKLFGDAKKDSMNSSTVFSKHEQSSILFARARLGISEGSGIGTLQRQGATQSPTSQRRAKSLDAPVISVHRLPPANAFSSKDDTIEINEEIENKEISIELQNIEKGQEQPTQIDNLKYGSSDNTDYTTDSSKNNTSHFNNEIYYQPSNSLLKENSNIISNSNSVENSIVHHNNFEINLQEPQILESKEELLNTFIDKSSEHNSESIKNSSKLNFSFENIEYNNEIIHGQKIFKAEKNKHENQENKIHQQTEKSDIKENQKDENQFVESKKGKDNSTEKKIVDDKSPIKIVDNLPNITINDIKNQIQKTDKTIEETITADNNDFSFDGLDMAKSPIQISIEECSDDDCNHSDIDQEYNRIYSKTYEIDHQEEKGLDSISPIEDIIDTQISMQAIKSDVNSLICSTNKIEKTSVEIELKSDYLEMQKHDYDGTEELSEDGPIQKCADLYDSRLFVNKKATLNPERSRSEETNTWTPDREDPDSSSCSIARPLGIGQVQPIVDRHEIDMIKEAHKDVSLEDESSSSSVYPGSHRPELYSAWKSFPLESSGSSSLEEGWMSHDDNQHQSYSEENNESNDSSFQDKLIDMPVGFNYPISPEILANYGAFSLSRTLSRISERSTTSEQDKSDIDDSFKPSSRSPSFDDESLISSDHQPSLSSDPPSGTAVLSVSEERRTSSELPEIPIDTCVREDGDKSSTNNNVRLQSQISEDWPSPPSSPFFDTAEINHVQTFYMDINPEKAVKISVTDSNETSNGQNTQNSDSSDDNRTFHDDLQSNLEDNQSSSTTIDGTVKIVVKPQSNSYITGSSHSEDTSMGLSISDWSSSNNTVRQFCQYSGTKSDDNSLAELGASVSDWSGSTSIIPQQYYTSISSEKSQSDTTTSEKSGTSMRPNSKCQNIEFENSSDNNKLNWKESITVNKNAEKEVDEVKDEFDEARKFVESQFDEMQQQFEDNNSISTPQVSNISRQQMLRNKCNEAIEENFDVLSNITDLSNSKKNEDQLYDNVPVTQYCKDDRTSLEINQGNSSEDMHKAYNFFSSMKQSNEFEWSSEGQHSVRQDLIHKSKIGKVHFDTTQNPIQDQVCVGTKSTERPVIVPTTAKFTPCYSTTSLSGESTTSTPPMQLKLQIRTKTLPYSIIRSPQSEEDTSSSMESLDHTSERIQRILRRKKQQKKHRVVVDLEIKDGQIISSTDSSVDVTTTPHSLLENLNTDLKDDRNNKPSKTK